MVITWFILAIIALIILISLRVIQQYERGVLFTLGKYTATLNPGLKIVIPILQHMKKIDMRQSTIDLQPQEVMTADQVNLRIDGVVFYRIISAEHSI
ncbi:MAG TPA: SPFH domain-containing protein, partial [Candidatus Nanoarchaeia archaeon]|nr:SPFH domain-containing protein [Candidatus Nanoarchaeia archaeon]